MALGCGLFVGGGVEIALGCGPLVGAGNGVSVGVGREVAAGNGLAVLVGVWESVGACVDMALTICRTRTATVASASISGVAVSLGGAATTAAWALASKSGCGVA